MFSMQFNTTRVSSELHSSALKFNTGKLRGNYAACIIIIRTLKGEGRLINSALYYELLICKALRYGTCYRGHTEMPRTRLSHACLTPHLQSTALWLVLISRLAEDKRLSWSGWLSEILRWFARPSVRPTSRESNSRPSSCESDAPATRHRLIELRFRVPLDAK